MWEGGIAVYAVGMEGVLYPVLEAGHKEVMACGLVAGVCNSESVMATRLVKKECAGAP